MRGSESQRLGTDLPAGFLQEPYTATGVPIQKKRVLACFRAISCKSQSTVFVLSQMQLSNAKAGLKVAQRLFLAKVYAKSADQL